MAGFRYDRGRDAYVLWLVGNRFGPVLRTSPPVDSTAASMEWDDAMDQLATRRRSGRFSRETASKRDPLKR